MQLPTISHLILFRLVQSVIIFVLPPAYAYYMFFLISS